MVYPLATRVVEYPLPPFSEKRYGVLEYIDFSSPYDEEKFKKMVKPETAFEGIVRKEDEGLPAGFGSEYCAKIKIGAGETINIVVPVKPSVVPVSVHFGGYFPDTVTIKFGHADPLLSTKTYIINRDGYGMNSFAWIAFRVPTWRSFGVAFLEITNTSSEDVYVYIYDICVATMLNNIMFERESIRSEVLLITVMIEYKLNNETFTVGDVIRHTYTGYDTVIALMYTDVRTDGVNPLTIDYIIGNTTILSASTTTTSYRTYYTEVFVRKTPSMKWVVTKFSYSTSGQAWIKRIFITVHPYTQVRRKPESVENTYTSDGDGTTDTVTIADFSSSVKHIYKLIKAYAEGDSNTTQLELYADGAKVWDFLKDGKTAVIPLEHVKKLELKVNDPGGGTKTTVKYHVAYIYEDTFLPG